MQKKRSLGVLIVEGIMYLLGRLPLKVHYAFYKFIAWLLESVFHYRTQVVDINLARSFPEKKYDELKILRKHCYWHMAITIVQMVWFGACRGAKGRERLRKSHIVEFTNPEEVNRMLSVAPQALLMQTHMGNWELMGGIREYAYSTPLEITLDEFSIAHHGIASGLWTQVMEWNRKAPVSDHVFKGYVHTDSLLRYAITNKGKRMCYAINTDQYPYMGTGSMSVQFMNQETRSMTGATAIACKLDMAVGYLRFMRRIDGGYEMSVVNICDHASQHTPEELMTRYYQLLEEDLKAQPWNYLWTHKRWK